MIALVSSLLSPMSKAFISLLNARRVEYLLVGGYAVGYYGYPRPTRDLDIWASTHPLNAAKLAEACQEFGCGLPELTVEPFQHGNRIIALQVPPLHVQILDPVIGRRPDVLGEFYSERSQTIEILTVQSGVDFEDCYADRVLAVLDGVEVNIVSLKHLKIIKRSGSRPKDQGDLANLP